MIINEYSHRNCDYCEHPVGSYTRVYSCSNTHMNNQPWHPADLVALFIITFIVTVTVLDTVEIVKQNSACEIVEQTRSNHTIRELDPG